MDASRLSVVVPTRDTRERTLRCLGGLAPAMALGAEVVVVDDGSRDGTAGAVVERFPAARVLRHEAAQGFTASANAGLEGARGAVLLLLNSDTEAEPAALSRLLDAFDDDPRVGVAAPRLLDPDGTPQWSGGAEPTLAWLLLLASGLPAALRRVPGYARLRRPGPAPGARVDWVSGAAVAIRREAWKEVGPFDGRFRFYAQDLDFCSRARDAGWRVRLVEEARVVHVGGATIGLRAGATRAGTHPGLLWTDLLAWAEKRRGRRWALAASRGLLLGARVRLAARGLVATTGRRGSWSADSEAFRLGVDEVRRWRAERRAQG